MNKQSNEENKGYNLNEGRIIKGNLILFFLKNFLAYIQIFNKYYNNFFII